MFDNFIRWDGIDVVNAERTRVYAEALGLSWFNAPAEYPGIPEALSQNYTTPAADNAPWYDVRYPETADFAGVEVVSMTPIIQHTSTRTTTPLLTGGGVVSPAYHGPREIVVRALVLAKTRQAAVRGFSWLRHALEYASDCGDDPTNAGVDCMMWTQAPEAGCGTGGDRDYRRYLLRSYCTSGPLVLRERDIQTCDGHMIEVEWTITVGNPYIYGEYTSIATQNGGADTSYAALQAAFATYADVQAVGTYYEVLDYLWNDGIPSGAPPPDAEPDTIPTCHFDPDCPPPPAIPNAPQSDELSCHNFHSGSFLRRTFTMEAQGWPEYVELVPTVILSSSVDHTDVRVRFSPASAPPGSFSHEFYITWLPAGGKMTLCARRDHVVLECGGVTRDATHLVFSSRKAGAFRWPELMCGTEWTLSLDVPSDQNPSDILVTARLHPREP